MNSSKKKKPSPRPKYTHIDSGGMKWRMVGSRPVSALAARVMRAAGLPLRKDS